SFTSAGGPRFPVPGLAGHRRAAPGAGQGAWSPSSLVAHTAYRGSPAVAGGVHSAAVGGPKPRARPPYYPARPPRPSSLVASQPRLAVVGKQRLEKVTTSGPPGRSTRATSRTTSTGRTR